MSDILTDEEIKRVRALKVRQTTSQFYLTKTDFDALLTTLDQRTNELCKAKALISLRVLDIADLEKERDELKRKVDELKREDENIMKECNRLADVVDGLEEQNAELKRKVEELQKHIDDDEALKLVLETTGKNLILKEENAKLKETHEYELGVKQVIIDRLQEENDQYKLECKISQSKRDALRKYNTNPTTPQ